MKDKIERRFKSLKETVGEKKELSDGEAEELFEKVMGPFIPEEEMDYYKSMFWEKVEESEE